MAAPLDLPLADLRRYRNSRLYRSLTRTLRIYNRMLVARLQRRGFPDFSPAFPQMLSNLDTAGTRIGVLAERAGVTRQAAGQLLKEIARKGFVVLRPSPDDARVTMVHFTARGRKLLATVIELVVAVEADFAKLLPRGEYDRVRASLLTIADAIDPGGALGAGDAHRNRKRAVHSGARSRRGKADRGAVID